MIACHYVQFDADLEPDEKFKTPFCCFSWGPTSRNAFLLDVLCFFLLCQFWEIVRSHTVSATRYGTGHLGWHRWTDRHRTRGSVSFSLTHRKTYRMTINTHLQLPYTFSWEPYFHCLDCILCVLQVLSCAHSSWLNIFSCFLIWTECVPENITVRFL